MPKRLAALMIILLALFATGCDDVTVEHDSDTDFSAYQTYAWEITDPNDKRRLEHDYPQADQRLKAAMNREMTGKGLQLSTVEVADLLISYQVVLDVSRVGSDMDELGRTGAIGVPIGSTGTAWSNATFHDTVKKGTLILGMVDRKADKLVWQGRFSKKFRNPSDLRPADVRQSIKRLFRDFPR